MKPFNIFKLLRRVLDRDRITTLYYDLIYWWTGGTGLTGFNYGYSPASDAVMIDASCEEPFQIELYRQIAETLGPDRLHGRRVLEISCGLGGGFDHLAKQFNIGYAVALDRSWRAVHWTKRRFRLPATQADARMLPFADKSFEVIINIEASHNYYCPEFGAEVARVLAPGGYLVLSDEREGITALVEARMRQELAYFGLETIQFRDVTENVIAACRLDAPRREALLACVFWPMRNWVRHSVGVETSPRYREFCEGRATYFILAARRRD